MNYYSNYPSDEIAPDIIKRSWLLLEIVDWYVLVNNNFSLSYWIHIHMKMTTSENENGSSKLNIT